MIISYFDKYNIDTENITEKLNIISISKTENASYISNMLIKTLKYLFDETDLKIENLNANIFNKYDETIIYFDNLKNDNDVINLNCKKLIFIGNHKTHLINEKVECINIKEYRKIKKSIKSIERAYIGFNCDSIDFTKYYYNKMRSYFLNVLNLLNEISVEELKDNTEKICTKILLNNKNFISNYELVDEKIHFKDMIKVYKILKENYDILKINEKEMFYLFNNNLSEIQKHMLNELDKIISILNKESKKEKISIIYDAICDDMLKEIHELNYCNFIDNKCITMRYEKGFPNSKENGCCNNTYKDRKKNCRYLKEDKTCSICSISCRVFTCKYLQDRGIDHGLRQYPIIDLDLIKINMYNTVFSFFTPKETIMKKM